MGKGNRLVSPSTLFMVNVQVNNRLISNPKEIFFSRFHMDSIYQVYEASYFPIHGFCHDVSINIHEIRKEKNRLKMGPVTGKVLDRLVGILLLWF